MFDTKFFDTLKGEQVTIRTRIFDPNSSISGKVYGCYGDTVAIQRDTTMVLVKRDDISHVSTELPIGKQIVDGQ